MTLKARGRGADTRPEGTVLWLDDRAAAQAGGAIVWCPSDGSACVDAGAADPAVATQTDAPDGKMYRRLKHVSGYTVVANRTTVGGS